MVGVSDSEGEAAFELAFDDSDYQATWTLIASRFGCGVAEIKLLLDTPVELCILFGDYDCDRDVDVADIMQVASRWRSRVGDTDYNPTYDLDGDGDIDVVDIMNVAARWGNTCVP